MKKHIRSNFYLDVDRLSALKALAVNEETSISDLVREGIDRVITERLNNPRRDRVALRQNLDEFLTRYAGSEPGLTENEIDDLVKPQTRALA
jgi:hypothetical protein